MVWFQCDDCGENLKKPKLASHFNRCSAHQLSCIDCGVVFDQHSVQAHTSCVSEVEKYGPKGVKSANPVTTNLKNGKAHSGPDVDLSRGLTQRPPWSCSLCNVKATSREALELHAQGKKHRSRSKAVAAKETPPVYAKDVVVDKMEFDNSVAAGKGAPETTPHVDVSSSPPEKKRKNEEVDGAGEVEGELKTTKKDKKAKKEALNSDVDEKGLDVPADPTCKKRKHVEEEHETTPGPELKCSGKKSKKKDKLSVSEENGHISEKAQVVFEAEVIDQEEKKKDKKSKKGKKVKEEGVNGNNLQKVPDENPEDALVNGAPSAHDVEPNGDCATPLVNGKKVKKGKGSNLIEEPVTPEPVKTPQDDKSKGGKKEKHKKLESKAGAKDEAPKNDKEKETIVHEISFREWLGDDDVGGNGGTPTHPPMVDKSGEEHTTEPMDLDNEHIQAVSKVVKWKKIISEALGKSQDGRMKKKDLSKAVLSVALKAAEATAIPLDKLVLKEELMRQINCNPKFVMDGKHVMLAPKAK